MGRKNQQRRAAKKRERDRRRKASAPPRRDRGRDRTDDAPFGSGEPFDDAPWGPDGSFGDPDLAGARPDGLPDDGAGTDDESNWDDGLRHEASLGHEWKRDETVDVSALLGTAVASPGTSAAARALATLVSARDAPPVWRDATTVLVGVLDRLYENGWQPADLAHVATKKAGTAGQLLTFRAVQRHSARHADRHAPQGWVDQLRAIDEELGPPPDGQTTAIDWPLGVGLGLAGAWRELIGTLIVLAQLPVLQNLMDPPSKWAKDGDEESQAEHSPRDRHRYAGSHRASDSGSGPWDRAQTDRAAGPLGTGHDPKELARIRALLAKAESTEFPEEAEALSQKAQALMSRYSIDGATVDGGSDGRSRRSKARARRVHVDSPYASAKVRLLGAVGAANRVRAIWHGDLDMATVVGFPLDLDLVEMLYTSLLVQATRAMTDAGRVSSADRSRSFRRAFLLSYAHRVGERLSQASAHEADDAARRVAGTELVLARRSREVDDEFDRLFPRSRTMRTSRVDARGWHAGREAADRATIARGWLDSGA